MNTSLSSAQLAPLTVQSARPRADQRGDAQTAAQTDALRSVPSLPAQRAGAAHAARRGRARRRGCEWGGGEFVYQYDASGDLTAISEADGRGRR